MTVMGIEPSGTEASWTINVDTDEMKHLREVHSSIEEEQFQSIVERALHIMSNFPNPYGPDEQNTGLAIGKIQSGKTLSFTTLIALAGSNGYRVIIVLAGTKNSLLRQTRDRLERDLGTKQAERTSRILVRSNPTRQNHDLIGTALSPLANRTVLIVCLKHPRHIDNVRDLLSSPEMPQVPTLIIDDEGDEASHNRLPPRRRRARNAAPLRESATHRSIRQLRDSVRKHVYLAYTATPQANLLLPRIAELSPRFCELISPGPGYCGGSVFFGDNTINRYVMQIDEGDAEPPEGVVITQSLRRALSTFFVSAAIRHIRASNEKHTMLIHTDRRTEAHAQTMDALLHLLVQWRTRIAPGAPDQSTKDLLALFQESYREFQKTVRDPPNWSQVLERLPRELHTVEVHMVNSLPEASGAAEAGFQLENNIVVGGNMLGRGVTIQELAITYITRMARESNADTMEQRARWFGYKEGYLDLCRIWMTDQLRDIYVDLLRHEDDFWESLERHKRQGIPITEWPRFFRLDSDNLRPTRSEVARSERFRITGWRIMQPSIPAINPSVVEENLQVVDAFVAGRKPESIVLGNIEHHVYRNLPLDQVIDMLVSRVQSGRDWDTEYVSEYLRRLQFGNILGCIDVVLMRANDDSTFRSPGDNGRINPMQGRNRRPGDPNYYPGDANIHNDMPQLQIHRYRYREGGPRTCSLALYMPEEEQFDLSYIVGGEDI
jgi:hypothetical protein